ncbi:hypothetical protein ACVWWK_004080 [Bradyrhizobium sp. LB9.1b]
MTKTWLTNAAIAVWISTNSVLILLYGVSGTKGHAAVTAAVMIAPLLVVSGKFRPLPADYLFAALAALMVASVVVHGRTTTDRDYALLALSMAAYPAFRAVGGRFSLSRFSYITAALVLVGTLLTAWAVVYDQSGEIKPLVLGFHEGPTVFTLAWCFLVFALLSIPLPSLQWHVVGGLIAVPAFVFAAAMVRHPFIALALTLVATARMGSRRQIAGNRRRGSEHCHWSGCSPRDVRQDHRACPGECAEVGGGVRYWGYLCDSHHPHKGSLEAVTDGWSSWPRYRNVCSTILL